MEESKSQIQKLCMLFKDRSLRETVSSVKQELRADEVAHRTKTEAIEDSISQVKRKSKQMEAEVERQQMHQSKNVAGFSKKNSERIRLSRKIIELEQENEEIEMGINELTEKIGKAEGEVRVLSYPTVEELYYEIVRGFGVEFEENEGKVLARIVSKSKNDVFEMDCEETQDVCEKIWECIDF